MSARGHRFRDSLRVFKTGVIARHNELVGEFFRDRAHDRTLARVAVAAGTHDRPELAAAGFRHRAQRGERLLNGVRRMAVVDNAHRLIRVRDLLKTAGRRREALRHTDHVIQTAARGEHHADRADHVVHIEETENARFHVTLFASPAEREGNALRADLNIARLEQLTAFGRLRADRGRRDHPHARVERHAAESEPR